MTVSQKQQRTITYSAGGIRSNVGDLIIWANAIISRQLLSEESWSEIFDGGQYSYGYGWNIWGVIYEHGGATFGFNADILIWQNKNVKNAILSNTEGSSTSAATIKINSKVTSWFLANK